MNTKKFIAIAAAGLAYVGMMLMAQEPQRSSKLMIQEHGDLLTVTLENSSSEALIKKTLERKYGRGMDYWTVIYTIDGEKWKLDESGLKENKLILHRFNDLSEQ